MKIFENALLLAVVQFVNLALPLLWLPYLAITLGPNPLGSLAVALSLCQLILMLTDYGFNLSGPREIATHRDNPEKIAEIWIAITSLRAMLAILGFFLVLVTASFFDNIGDNIQLISIAYVMVVGNVIYPQWLFQGLEKLRMLSIIQVIVRLIILCSIFVLVKGPEDIYWAAFLQSAGQLLVGLIAAPFTLKAFNGAEFRRPRYTTLWVHLKDGWHIFMSSAAINIYTTSNALLLGIVANPLVVGHYYVADKMIRAALMIFSPITSAAYPHIARLVSAKDFEAFQRLIEKVVSLFACISLILSVGIFLCAAPLITGLFGSQYSAAIPVLQAFAILPIPLAASSILGTLIMLPCGMQREVSFVLLAAVVVDLVIFIPAAHFYGAIGAAATNIAVESFVTIALMGFWYNRAKDLKGSF
jgi:PST family polysaccharide transporter